jgi:hypothetical protein
LVDSLRNLNLLDPLADLTGVSRPSRAYSRPRRVPIGGRYDFPGSPPSSLSTAIVNSIAGPKSSMRMCSFGAWAAEPP